MPEVSSESDIPTIIFMKNVASALEALVQNPSPEVMRIRERLRQLKAEGKPLDLSLFHFETCREALKNFKGSLSDAVREERDRW